MISIMDEERGHAIPFSVNVLTLVLKSLTDERPVSDWNL